MAWDIWDKHDAMWLPALLSCSQRLFQWPSWQQQICPFPAEGTFWPEYKASLSRHRNACSCRTLLLLTSLCVLKDVQWKNFGGIIWERQLFHASNSRKYCLQGGCWPLVPGRINTPSHGKRSGMGSRSKEAITAEHYPVDNREAMGCRLCSSLIHKLQMGDITGAIVPCHLVNEYVSDASQCEAQQTAYHVIT